MKQLVTYFGFSYLISWLIWLPLYGHAFGLGGLPTLPLHHGIGGLGPLVAAFLTTWIFNKNEGIKQLLKRCIQIKPLIYLALAFLSPFLLAILSIIMYAFINQSSIYFRGLLTSKEFPQFHILTFFMYNIVFFGFGEEVGWRGFALPRLQNTFNALTSSVVLTFFWALWHWPLFFYRPGYMTMDMFGIVGWVFSLLTGSILLTWFFNASRGSILICAIFHSTIDIAFTANFVNNSIINYMGFLITLWGILTIVIFKPKNLAKQHKFTIGPFGEAQKQA